MTATPCPIASHDEGEEIFSPADPPWGRLGNLDSLFIDARIGFLALKMILGKIVDVPGGVFRRLRGRVPERVAVVRVPELDLQGILLVG